MRLALWNRLQWQDKVIQGKSVYTVANVFMAAHGKPNLVQLSGPLTGSFWTELYDCYECATIDVDRLLDELEAMDDYREAMDQEVSTTKPNVRTIELRIPEPGDELPFTVYDNGQGGGLRYNLAGSFTIGCKQGWLVCTDAAIALGLPQSVEMRPVVTQVKEEQS